jgi:hypothetical protein
MEKNLFNFQMRKEREGRKSSPHNLTFFRLVVCGKRSLDNWKNSTSQRQKQKAVFTESKNDVERKNACGKQKCFLRFNYVWLAFELENFSH